MSGKSILFNEAMVCALIEGRKTQTRRPLSLIGHDVFSEFGISDTTGYDWCFRDEDSRWHEFRNDELLKLLRCQTGDRLWVREDNKSRAASRITLIVTDVRVQRLQDISEEDAIAEGATCRPSCTGFKDSNTGWSMDWSRVGEPSRFATGADGKATPLTERDVALGSAKYAFANFWNSISCGAAWEANPWVSAITFTVHHCNIDQMAVAA